MFPRKIIRVCAFVSIRGSFYFFPLVSVNGYKKVYFDNFTSTILLRQLLRMGFEKSSVFFGHPEVCSAGIHGGIIRSWNA